jgi:hypothetical protein
MRVIDAVRECAFFFNIRKVRPCSAAAMPLSYLVARKIGASPVR